MNAPRFIPFSFDHLVALVVCLVLAVLVPVVARRLLSLGAKHRLAVAIGVLLLIQELVKVPVRISLGVPLEHSLPLHLCGIAALLMAWVMWRRSPGVFDIAYYWAVAGSLAALLMPDLPISFPDFRFLVFFAAHGLNLMAVFYALLVLGMRPGPHSLYRAITATVLLAIVMMGINHLMGTNYLYLMAKPGQASILDAMGPWPWYLLPLAGIALIVVLLCYLPFMRKTHDKDA